MKAMNGKVSAQMRAVDVLCSHSPGSYPDGNSYTWIIHNDWARLPTQG